MTEHLTIKISIQQGQKKSFRGKQIITERLLNTIDDKTAKETAMAYFSRIWDEAHGVAVTKPSLRLVKE